VEYSYQITVKNISFKQKMRLYNRLFGFTWTI
jgi:hypothetical protein